MQARDCLNSASEDEWCMSGSPLHGNPLWCPDKPLFCNIFWKARQAPEDCWILICCNREQKRGIAMYFHTCMHASILVPPITHLDEWWTRSRIAWLNMKWMHMKTQLKPNSIMDNPECRWLGNWDTFRHSEYETYLVSRVRVNSYPKHNAICMTCMKCN